MELIRTITNSEFWELLDIYQKYPNLSLQNVGYEEPLLDESDELAVKRIESILKESIKDFVRFQNFSMRQDGFLQIRLQYRWDDDICFVGVGYVTLKELVKGYEV